LAVYFASLHWWRLDFESCGAAGSITIAGTNISLMEEIAEEQKIGEINEE
jgi:hypothetical protein